MDIEQVATMDIPELLERGLVLTAWARAQERGDFPRADSPSELILAARMGWQLGAPTRSRWLARRAWREFPHDQDTRYFHAFSLMERRGPYDTWRFVESIGDVQPDATIDQRCSWYSLRAEIAGAMRDFDLAESWMSRAAEVQPNSPWRLVCHAHVLEWEDRYEVSLETARRACAIRPWYRPAVQAIGHLLSLLNRETEAVDFLREALQNIESAHVAAQCYGLLLELDRFGEAAEMLDKYVALSPLMEKRVQQWLAAQRSILAYEAGNWDEAVQQARLAKTPYHTRVADRLSEPGGPERRRVELVVPFVRQHHVTCVPATLTAIARFWSQPVDHVRLADEICYNGTSAYNERHWADTHGWRTREFTVNLADTEQLLDRGIPFTLTTVGANAAHLQAVIGYDSRRGTLLIRDPYSRHSGSALAEEFLSAHQSSGPRGMALVPVERADLLESLVLADSQQWDVVHRLDEALVQHRRTDAQAIVDQMLADWPEHWLTVEARRRLALYDADLPTMLAMIESQLARTPDDERLQLARLSCLRDLSRRSDRLDTFRQLCEPRTAHPTYCQQYAQELLTDAARHDEVESLARRAMRAVPLDPGNYYLLANLRWDQQRREEACELYRFAACMDDKDEEFAMSYFVASRWLKQTDEALRFLRGRFERLGAKSSLPARTLYDAYERLERSAEGADILRRALQQRPNDGPLLLFAAVAFQSAGQEPAEVAQDLMRRAEGQVSRVEWLRTSSRLATMRGDLREALDRSAEIVALQPLSMSARIATCRLIHDIEGTPAVLKYLESATNQFPNYHPLWELRGEWMLEEPVAVREPMVRRLIEHNPDNAWARRELGFMLCDAERFAEAWEEYRVAAQLDPHNLSTMLLRAYLHRRQGKLVEAQEAFRDTLRHSVDSDLAINGLMEISLTLEEKRGALEFIRSELQRQVIFGDGLLAYRRHARIVLGNDELLGLLRDALAARPDLWHAWSALTQQLLTMNQLDEAMDLSRQAVERFPLLPRLWLDQAQVCRARGDWEGQHEALEAIFRINPMWDQAISEQKEARVRRGDFDGARRLLEQAVHRDPRNAVLQLDLAELLHYSKDVEGALRLAETAVRLQPSFDDAWQKLLDWSGELQRNELPAEIARQLTSERSHVPAVWLALARVLPQPEQLEECLQALDKVVALEPRSVDAFDLRGTRLAAAERFEEALAACHPPVFGDHPPIQLRVNEAEILDRRGERDQAVALLESILAGEPHYYYGWLRLAAWYRQTGPKDKYLHAAKEMARLAPHHDMSLGYLAEALMENEDRAGAKEVFLRAFELSPSYEFAGFWAFDLQLEDSEYAAARETVARLRLHADGPLLWAREVQLEAKCVNREPALAAAAKVFNTPSDNPWPVEAAARAATAAGWKREVMRLLRAAQDLPEPSLAVFTEWGTLEGTEAIIDEARLEDLATRGERGEQATYWFLERLVVNHQGDRAVRFIERNERWLARHTRTWATALYVYCALRQYRAALPWAQRWTNFQTFEPWMLVNAAEAFVAAGDWESARLATQRGLESDSNIGRPTLLVWGALDRVFAGDYDAAAELIASVSVEQLDADYRLLWDMIDSLYRFATAPASERTSAFSWGKSRLAVMRQSYRLWKLEPGRLLAYRRTVLQLAHMRGGMSAKVWSWFHWFESLLNF